MLNILISCNFIEYLPISIFVYLFMKFFCRYSGNWTSCTYSWTRNTIGRCYCDG